MARKPKVATLRTTNKIIWTMQDQITAYRRNLFVRSHTIMAGHVRHLHARLDLLGSLTNRRDTIYPMIAQAIFDTGDDFLNHMQDFIDQQNKHGWSGAWAAGTRRLDVVRETYEKTLVSKHIVTRLKNLQAERSMTHMTPGQRELVIEKRNLYKLSDRHRDEQQNSIRRANEWARRLNEVQGNIEHHRLAAERHRKLADRADAKVAELANKYPNLMTDFIPERDLDSS